jgi:hypothetical protein
MSTDTDKLVAESLERTWPFVVNLKYPINFGQERITSLEFRRGKLGDLKGIRPSAIPTIDELIVIASRMCGQPTKVIEQLDPDDSGEALELALGFFTRCLGAGSTP